jgi:solute:Na+ symporter, SSS family
MNGRRRCKRISVSKSYFGVSGYFRACYFVFGIRYSGRVEESDDLVLAGRGLSTPFLIPSILATWICAGAMMGAAGEAYTGGLQAVFGIRLHRS